jgi:hypothetical protein
LAYVVVTEMDGTLLQVIDVSNPSNPATVSSIRVTSERLNIPPGGVAVSGGYAFVAADVFAVVDVSGPAEPSLVAVMERGVSDVALAGNHAYLATWGNGEFGEVLIMDILDPSSPSLVGRVVTPGVATAITLSGSFAYVLGQGLQVIDVSVPRAAAIVRSVRVDGRALAAADEYVHLGSARYVGGGTGGWHTAFEILPAQCRTR